MLPRLPRLTAMFHTTHIGLRNLHLTHACGAETVLNLCLRGSCWLESTEAPASTGLVHDWGWRTRRKCMQVTVWSKSPGLATRLTRTNNWMRGFPLGSLLGVPLALRAGAQQGAWTIGILCYSAHQQRPYMVKTAQYSCKQDPGKFVCRGQWRLLATPPTVVAALSANKSASG